MFLSLLFFNFQLLLVCCVVCRKFRAALLRSGESEGMEVRTHYMKLRPDLALQEIMEKFNLLLITSKMGLRTNGRITKVKKVVEVGYVLIYYKCIKGINQFNISRNWVFLFLYIKWYRYFYFCVINAKFNNLTYNLVTFVDSFVVK